MKINPEKKQIVFVASELSDLNNLITALPSSAVVVKLDPFEDGLTQIARVLFNLKDLNSIHIVSHGSAGALQLGSTILNAGNIYDYLQQLSTIGSSLNVNGNIFIYGCSVAAGTDGQAFIQALAQLTKSDIAASSNITGSTALGGDWILESATGQINSTGFFQNTTSEEFQGTLSLPGIHIASNSSGIFLGGNFMELGIRTNDEIGKFGAETAPGGSFMGRTNANGNVISGIGLVGDADGFGTGSILNVDYFMPGEPEEGFYAGYKVSGVVTTGKNFGSSVINTSSGSTLSAVITGTVGSGTLEVIQTISFGVNDKYFINTVTLTNKSTNAIDNVRFMRSMDPDNTVDKSGSYTTVNTIENTFAAGDAYAAVSAKSAVGDSYYGRSGSNQAVILYYSTDSRAKVGMATSGLMPAGVYDNTVYDNASTKGTTGIYDAFISIAFDAGTLAPGASTTFDYYTVLDNGSVSQIINSLTSVVLNRAPVGSVVMSGSFNQGATVTASNNITDSNGLGAITYKWQSSTDAITWSEFATGSSFTLTESHVGKYLRINASYIDGRGTSESVNSSISSIVVDVNNVPSGSVSINGTIRQGSTVTASNTIGDLDGLGGISYKWESSSNLIQWADVKTGASLTIADAQVGKYLRVNATYIDGHGTNETVISDVSDLLRFGNHAPIVKPISKAVSISENTSFNFALPAGTFTEVDAGDKITYSSPNLLDGLYINPIAGTIYGKVGFTAANNPQHIITIKATDRSGAFATTQLTLNIVNVPALMGKTSIDTLIAGNGNDRIWGKGGADTLTGGSGADEFNFDASPLLGLSTITDFVPGVDKLRLSLKVFPTLGFVPSNATQTLISASLFETGSSISTATKATTRVFFNQSTSTLYYDADGLGGVAPTPIVKLLGVTTSLLASDIYIFN